jgi:hypothetical protein
LCRLPDAFQFSRSPFAALQWIIEMNEGNFSSDIERELRTMLSGIRTGPHSESYPRWERFICNSRRELNAISGFQISWAWSVQAEQSRVRLAAYARELEPDLDEAIDGFDAQISSFLRTNALNDAIFSGDKLLEDGRTMLSAVSGADCGGLPKLWTAIRQWLREKSTEWLVLYPLDGVKNISLGETSRIAGLIDPSLPESYQHVTRAFARFGGWNAVDGTIADFGKAANDQLVDSWAVARVRALEGAPVTRALDQILVTLGLLSCSRLPEERHVLYKSAANASRKIITVPFSADSNTNHSLSVAAVSTLWHRPPGRYDYRERQSLLERWSEVISDTGSDATRLRVSLMLLQQALNLSSSAQIVVGMASLDALFGGRREKRRSISEGLRSVGLADEVKRFEMLYDARCAISHGDCGSVWSWQGRESYLEYFGSEAEQDLLLLVGTAIGARLNALSSPR